MRGGSSTRAGSLQHTAQLSSSTKSTYRVGESTNELGLSLGRRSIGIAWTMMRRIKLFRRFTYVTGTRCPILLRFYGSGRLFPVNFLNYYLARRAHYIRGESIIDVIRTHPTY